MDEDVASNENGNQKEEDENEAEINECLKACGFGRFNLKFLLVTMVGGIADMSVGSTTSYLLPSAECDLNMSLLEKGVLNAATYTGMLFSTIVAGFLTDTFGRKLFVQLGYGGIFMFTVLEATSQTYEVLVVSKFFEGLLFASSFSAVITLIAELCHDGIRDSVMIFQASFGAVSQVIIAAISWATLTQDWKYTLLDGRIVFNTWNFYLLIMSSWSLIAFLLYTLLIPESPKYLLSQKKYAEARTVLMNIFEENSGLTADLYPYKNIWASEIEAVHDTPITSGRFSNKIVTGLHNMKPIFTNPLAGYLALICLSNFLTVSLYNIIRLWFPQLSTVLEHYDTSNDSDLCVMLDAYTSDLKRRNVTFDGCIQVKSGAQTYIYSMIIGCICIIPFYVTSFLVNKVGKKVLMVLGGLICSGATLGLRWVQSEIAVVALFAVDSCTAHMLISLNQAFIMQFFPTTISTLAIAVIMTAGRFGTLIGNVSFPIMLDLRCEVPFFSLAGLISVVVIIAFLLPSKKT